MIYASNDLRHLYVRHRTDRLLRRAACSYGISHKFPASPWVTGLWSSKWIRHAKLTCACEEYAEMKRRAIPDSRSPRRA